jgi:hypothetical protein
VATVASRVLSTATTHCSGGISSGASSTAAASRVPDGSSPRTVLSSSAAELVSTV